MIKFLNIVRVLLTYAAAEISCALYASHYDANLSPFALRSLIHLKRLYIYKVFYIIGYECIELDT